MNKYVKNLTLLFGLLVAWSSLALDKSEYNTADPYIMLTQIADTTFDRFNKEYGQIQADPEHLKRIIREELLPYVDYKYASFKVLGNKNLKSMNKAQIAKFIKVFRDYMVTVYAQVFTNYRSTQTVSVEPSKNVSGNKVVVVKSKIQEPGRPDIDVFFKLRKTKDKKTKQTIWLAFDLVAEGISVLDSKRKEINHAIKRTGVEAVIEDLKEKSQKPLVIKSSGQAA